MRIMMQPPDWQGVPDFTLEDGVVKARPGFNKVQIHNGFCLRANDWQYQDIMDMLIMGISVVETLGAGARFQAEFYWHVQGWPIIVNAQLADNVIYLFDLDETGTPGKSDKSPRNFGIFYTRGNWKPESNFEVKFDNDKPDTSKHKDPPANSQPQPQDEIVSHTSHDEWGVYITINGVTHKMKFGG